MPDETKKVVARIEQLEKVNKDLTEKLRLLKVSASLSPCVCVCVCVCV
jgi:hypothetical protein